MTELIVLLNSSGLVFDMIILVSSANSIESAILFMVNGKSFMYMIRNESREN